MKNKLITTCELKTGEVKRLSAQEYNSFITKVNLYLLDIKEKDEARIVFGNSELNLDHFPDSLIQLFDDEMICESTAKRFTKALKKSGFTVHSYNGTSDYFYTVFNIEW